MRIPDPKANTTTEAYLAYKAGYLTQGELKPVLYEPYLHFDAWLAYWCGLTNEYPLDNNGNPEMLCDEEALVAYLAGVTDTYPEEIKDPYDVRIVGYLRHIANDSLPAPDYPVNNSEFYLSMIGHSAEPVVNPEPSSNFTLETSAGKLINVEIYGDTTQAESPAPSTDAPQDVLVVSGLQKITISDGGSNSKDYWLDLGGEMYDMNAITDGKYINSSGATVTYSTWNTTDYMPVVAGEGYLYRGISDAGRYPYSAYYDQDKVLVSTFKQRTGNNTLIIPEGVAYVRFSLANADVRMFSFMSDGQSVELGSIAGFQDYIYKDGNDWYIHKATAHYVVDGSDEWDKAVTGTNAFNISPTPLCVKGGLSATAGVAVVFSTHFKGVSYNGRNTSQSDVIFAYGTASQTSRGIGVRNTPFTTVAEIQDFCSTTPVDLYYVLSTATDTKITDARLVSQLEALLDGESYNGTTHIVVTSGATGIPALLKVTAEGL